MIIKPVITEKSIANAKEGNYTFYVDSSFGKHRIRRIIEDTFDVKVIKVRTINLKGEVKKNYKGRKKIVMPRKKAIVTLQGDDQIDLFEEKKSKKKGKKK